MRGLIPLVGFASTCVFYERRERIAGKTHYPLLSMVSLALEGITSLSVKPIKLIAGFGICVSICSVIGILLAVVVILRGNSEAMWAAMICLLCFLGGVQMMSIGMIGEYIGKIYLEVKARPRCIIRERTADYDNICFLGGGDS